MIWHPSVSFASLNDVGNDVRQIPEPDERLPIFPNVQQLLLAIGQPMFILNGQQPLFGYLHFDT